MASSTTITSPKNSDEKSETGAKSAMFGLIKKRARRQTDIADDNPIEVGLEEAKSQVVADWPDLPKKGLGPLILKSHLKIAFLGLLCSGVILMGSLWLNNLTRKAASEKTVISTAITAIKSGLESAQTSLRTSTISGNREFLIQYNSAWTEQIAPYQKSLNDAIKNSRFRFWNSKRRVQILTNWSEIEQRLHHLNGTETALNTLLIGSKKGRVYHIPAENLMADGNAIIAKANELREQGLVSQSELAQYINDFQDNFHKAHAETLLFLLQEGTAEQAQQAEQYLKRAQKELDEVESLWPQKGAEEKKIFLQLTKLFDVYLKNTIDALADNQAFTAQSQIQTYLALVSQDTKNLLVNLDELQVNHNLYIRSWLNWFDGIFIAIGLLTAAVTALILTLSYRSARKLSKRIIEPIDRQSVLLDGFQRTSEAIQVPVQTMDELGRLTTISNAARQAIAEKIHVLATNHAQKKHDHARAVEILEQASQAVQQKLKSLQLELSEYLHELQIPQQNEILKFIREEHDILSAHSRRLRLFSLLEQEKLKPQEEQFSPVQIIEDALHPFANKAGEKSLTLINYIDPDLPQHLVADVKKIRMILSELLSNAIEYTPSGAISLSLLAGEKTDGFQEIDFIISNTGDGLPTMTAQTLGQRSVFRAPDNTKSDDTPSPPNQLGLGLILASRLAQTISAWVETKSIPLEGTRAQLSLKAQVVSPLTISSERQIAADQKVLILERCPLIAQTLKQQLEAWGLEPHLVESPKQFAEMLSNKKFRKQTIEGAILSDGFTKHRLDDLEQILKAIQQTFKDIKCILTTNQNGNHGVVSHPVYKRTHCLKGPILESQIWTILRRTAGSTITKSNTTATVTDDAGFNLNLISPKPTTNELTRDKHPILDESHQSKKSMRVLLADNEDGYHVVLSNLLRQLGYECQRVPTGEAALSALQSRHFDLILLSVSLSGMNGLETARQIRKLPTSAQTPILALAPEDMGKDIELFKSAGMTGHLIRPIDIDLLEETIRRYAA